MRAVVTGGAGFIGSHVVEGLARSGATAVMVVDDLSSGRPENLSEVPSGTAVDLEQRTIEDPELAGALKGFKPEVVFHMAAQASVVVSVRDPIADAHANVLGLINVCEAAVAAGARKIVFASSGGTVYGDPPAAVLPVPETYDGRPTSPYGITKKVAHDYLAFYSAVHSLAFTALALSNVYGPRQDPHGEAGVIAIWSRAMIAGKDCLLFGDGEQTRDFVYVSDVADAFVRAGETGKADGEVVNIGTGVQTSVNDLYRSMAGALRVDAPPLYQAARPGELRRISLDPSKAKRTLGWEPRTPLDEGIAATTAWFAAVTAAKRAEQA